MFHDPKDEDRLCHVLKAYVEEWGPENVVVSVPLTWRQKHPTATLGRVRLEFVTNNTVSIRVEDINKVPLVCYDVLLNA